MSEAKRGRGRREQPTVSIHLRVSPLEAELIDLRLAYMAEDAASKNGKPTCKTRSELLRYLLQDVEFLGRPFPQAGPWRERADAIIAKYDPADQGAEPGAASDYEAERYFVESWLSAPKNGAQECRGDQGVKSGRLRIKKSVNS